MVNEVERVKSVKRFDNYDFNLNKSLEDILILTAEICETPTAFLTLIDEENEWFKVTKGLDVSWVPRETSICNYTIKGTDVLVIADTLVEEPYSNLPIVKQPPYARFYAGAPLTTEEGYNIGTLCVFDNHSKELSKNKKNLLGILAKQAMHLMELELSIKELKQKSDQITLQNNTLKEIAFTQAHEFRGPVATIMGLMNVIKEDNYESPIEYLKLMEETVYKLDEKILLVVKSTHMIKELHGN